jgi:hypothetical protein
LRNHFTVINDERLREAADAVRTASTDDGSTRARIAELESGLVELTELRQRLSTGAYPAVDAHGGRRLASVKSPR